MNVTVLFSPLFPAARDSGGFRSAPGYTTLERPAWRRVNVVGIRDWALIGYTLQVIVRFRPKGLQLLFEKED